ncbi:2-succinylbenzoate--CoA ligase [Pantanalinema sp. GBBB05]|uniref:2-succinylbenzoate--CoA ligase n=1 Tax=Pantanalinema sp. GBBB05 TaxID=2604139 RepID=UPI001DBF6C66|nr:2-succinylbenzoate--CoA ligase [Pantanalinema sp. GBBB05]
MADPLTYLNQRHHDDWLIGQDSRSFFRLAQHTYKRLQPYTDSPQPPIVLIADTNPANFLAYFLAACAADCTVILADANWVNEWQQLSTFIYPQILLGDGIPPTFPISLISPMVPIPHPAILIPTSGSSGQLRFTIHTWDTLMASVEGFCQYFQVDRVNSFCVLRPHHVSGLMQFMRSLTSGGKLALLPFSHLESENLVNLDPSDYFLSLVPTQLHRLLSSSVAPYCLTRFQTVLLGGAPAWEDLLMQARSSGIRLAPTYGMTETASQIATLQPDDFLQGKSGCGQMLPHAEIVIRSESGDVLPTGQVGVITVQARSLTFGYYAASGTITPLLEPGTAWFSTDDLGFYDAEGYLHLVGRNSHKIITGGENVFPAEVEAAIRATGLVADVCVIGVDDREWGQAITAIYVPSQSAIAVTDLKTALDGNLSRFKHPKHWLAVDQLPRNAQGKLNRLQVQQLVDRLTEVSHDRDATENAPITP